MPKICTSFWFCAAHRLSKGYKGKCANLHGHNYKVEVTIAGYDLNDHDMLVDFNDLKPVISLMEEQVDHTLILCKDDPVLAAGLEDLAGEFGFRLLLLSNNPTVEVLARYILGVLRSELARDFGCWVQTVRVWETHKNWAEAS